MQYDDKNNQTTVLAEIPRSAVENCYYLMLKKSPLMLTQQGNDDRFQILWPERMTFDRKPRGSFLFRDGKKMYFSIWNDEPKYFEEIIVQNMDTKENVDRFPGSIMNMPDGQAWILV